MAKVVPHRKHITIADVEPKVLNVTKNGDYDSPTAPFTSVHVNVLPKLQSKIIKKNGIIKPDYGYDGFSEIDIDISPVYSFVNDGFQLIRVKYNDEIYLSLLNSVVEYPDYANTNSQFVIAVNPDSKYTANLYPVNKKCYITDSKFDDYIVGDKVKIAVMLFNSIKVFEEEMTITGECTLL